MGSKPDRGYIVQSGDLSGKQLIVDSFPLVIKDIKIVEESLSGVKRKILKFGGQCQKGGALNENMRVYPIDVLKEAVNSIQPDIKARAVLGELEHPCHYSADFNVLTVLGWKKFIDIKIGDEVWSRVNGKMIKSTVNDIIDEPYDGLTYNIKGRNIDACFTPHHKVLLEKRYWGDEYAKLESIYNNRTKFSHHKIPRIAEWGNDNIPTVTIPGIMVENLKLPINRYKNDITKDLILDSKLFCAFLGIYLAEGNLNNGNSVIISQFNPVGKKLVKDLLSQFPNGLEWNEVKRGFSISDLRLYAYLKPLGDKYNKFIPHEIKQLSSECLEELIHWFMIGDGRMASRSEDNRYLNVKDQFINEENVAVLEKPRLELGKYSRSSIFSTSKRLVDDLHECLVKTGRCGKLSTIITEEDYLFADHIIEAKNKKPLYQLSISRSKYIHLDKRFLSIEPVHHKGNIYCLTTEHGNFYMEHNGHSFWTGNSDAKIHLDRVSHLVTRMWMDDKGVVFCEGEILAGTIHGQQLKALFEAGVRVSVSSRGVGDMEDCIIEGKECSKVLPGYSFITIDIVQVPSVSGSHINLKESIEKRKTIIDIRKLNEEKLLKEIKGLFE